MEAINARVRAMRSASHPNARPPTADAASGSASNRPLEFEWWMGDWAPKQ